MMLSARPDVERSPVGLRVDGDGGDAEFAAGARDTNGDLAPIGDEDLAEHYRGQNSETKEKAGSEELCPACSPLPCP